MHDSRPVARHVSGLLADLAAEHGEVEVVRRQWDCEPDAYDALRETFERFGVVGGATARVRDAEGRLLLVRTPDAGETLRTDAERVARDGDTRNTPDGEDGTTGSTDVWTDPGDARRPGEDYRECARRAVRAAAGIDIQIEGLAAVHLHLASDWTDRPPLPDPALVFEARPRESSTPMPGDGVVEVGWFETLPDDLLYEGLDEAASVGPP